MKLPIKTLFAVLTFSLFAAAPAEASDWVIPGGACKVALGSVNTLYTSKMVATGGTAVITCNLLRERKTNNLSTVYVRIHKVSPYILPITLTAFDNFGNNASSGNGFVNQNSSGNISTSVPIPATVNGYGYVSVNIVLGEGDTLHSVRYIQN